MAIDAATRDSLELCRSVSGSIAGSLLGEIDRCQTAAGRRLLASDISAPLTDKGQIEATARSGRLAPRQRAAPRPHALRAQGDARLRARARAGSPPDAEARATSPSCATA